MWECFSYYGMRVLLVLFLIHEMQFADSEAFALYAIYTALIELGGLFGGILADKFFGLKRAIALGASTIVCGHLALSIPGLTGGFFLGLGLIVVGTSLFRSNVAALLGKFYHEGDPRRDAGFTLYYTGMNIGGFLATLLCGIAGEIYGWHAGFSLAALGMLSGTISLWFGEKLLEGKGNGSPFSSKKFITSLFGILLASSIASFLIYQNFFTMKLLPLAALGGIFYFYRQFKNLPERGKMFRLSAYVVFLMIFFVCEEQLGSSLVLFAERHLSRQTAFGVLPAASLITFNPLTILIIGPLLSRLMQKIPISGMNKIAISYFFLGSAFSLLFLGCLSANNEGMVSLSFAICSVILIALGEIFIGPTVFAYASEAAPNNSIGLAMGMVTVGFGLANLLSGFLSQTMAILDEASSIEIYASSFKLISLSILGLALLIFLFTNKTKKGFLKHDTYSISP